MNIKSALHVKDEGKNEGKNEEKQGALRSAQMKNERCDIGVPKFLRKLLEYTTPKDYRNDVLGDLREEFFIRENKFGISSARRWYSWQALISAVRFIYFRVREFVFVQKLIDILFS